MEDVLIYSYDNEELLNSPVSNFMFVKALQGFSVELDADSQCVIFTRKREECLTTTE